MRPAIGIVLAFIMIFGFVQIGKVVAVRVIGTRSYETGRYAKYCYARGRANGNIKHPIYYQTLELCGKPLASK